MTLETVALKRSSNDLKPIPVARTLMAPRLRHILCLAMALLGMGLKFWLIAEMEIPDASDDPHEYVLQILHPANGGLSYPPGTGLVGRLFYDLKIPFRLGTEALFILATALVLRALLAWPSRSYLALGLFLFTILNPNPADEFSHLMSDQIWSVETMAGLSCVVLALEKGRSPRWAYLAPAVLLLGLTALTRSTFIPLFASLLLFVLLTFLFIAAKSGAVLGRNYLTTALVSAWALLFGVGLIYYGDCFYNSKRFGYFGVSAVDCREYLKFYSCLQSVGEADGAPYFPIDENRRKLIREAGPTSRWLIGQVENNHGYKQVGMDHYGIYDIPAGWFQFAAFNAVLPAVDGDLRKAYARFQAVEDEITTAHREGRLKVRGVFLLPDSRLSLVWAAFPEGLEHTTAAVLYQPGPEAFTWTARKAKYESSEFSQAATRRTVYPGPLRENAWGILCAIYSRLYGLPAFCLYLASLAAFLVVEVWRWNPREKVPLAFLAQQLFTIFFAVHFLWYALFDASGVCVSPRYMLYQNVMLPLLIAYYLAAVARQVTPDKRPDFRRPESKRVTPTGFEPVLPP
jgi:hypothetical protein